MKKSILAAAGIVLIGYTISEVVTYNDPFVNNAFGDLTLEEISEGIPTITVASGEDSVMEEGPPSDSTVIEDSAFEDGSFDEPPFEIMSVESIE